MTNDLYIEHLFTADTMTYINLRGEYFIHDYFTKNNYHQLK